MHYICKIVNTNNFSYISARNEHIWPIVCIYMNVTYNNNIKTVIPIVEFSVSIGSTSIRDQNLSATFKIIDETYVYIYFLNENDSNSQTLICIYEENKIICRYKTDIFLIFQNVKLMCKTYKKAVATADYSKFFATMQ